MNLAIVFVFILCTGAVVTASSSMELPEPTPTSCWTMDNQPSCQNGLDNSNINFATTNAQHECGELHTILEKYQAVWTLEDHVHALAEIQAGTDKCEAARAVYPKCIWCLSFHIDGEHRNRDQTKENRSHAESSESSSLQDFCTIQESDCAIPPNDNGNGNTEVTQYKDETCSELEDVWRRGEQPMTVDLCLRSKAAVHACDFYCRDGARHPVFRQTPDEGSCWTLDDPPDCSFLSTLTTSLDDYHDDDDDDFLQDTCFRLTTQFLSDPVFYSKPWTHVQALAPLRAGTEECAAARQAYPRCGFCHPQSIGSPGFCQPTTACQPPAEFDFQVDVQQACIELEQLIEGRDQWPATADLCYQAEMSLFACPFHCEVSYLGADTQFKKWLLVWLTRTASFLSIGGSLCILHNILCVHPLQHRTIFYQLIVAMTVCDLFTSASWAFGTTPLPKDAAWQIVGARGNQATCQTQAFFVQLGFTSVLYNTSLTAYYILVIVYRWRESDLQRIRWWLLGGPFALGLGLACLIVPFAVWTIFGCHMTPPPFNDVWKVLAFIIIPLGGSILIITIGMLFLYYEVWKNARQSRKWSFGVGHGSRLETQVFWQSLFYTLSFYLTWPLVFALGLGFVDYSGDSYALAVTVSFLGPMQGFWNFLVFIRPKVRPYIERHFKCISIHFPFHPRTEVFSATSRHMEQSERKRTENDDDDGGGTIPGVAAEVTATGVPPGDGEQPVQGGDNVHTHMMDPSARIAM